MSTLAAAVGKRISRLRRQRRWTQEHLAERTGLTAKFISEVETGKTNPSLHTLESISGALRVSLPALFASTPRVRKSRKDQLIEEFAGLVRDQSPQKVRLLLKGFKAALF